MQAEEDIQFYIIHCDAHAERYNHVDNLKTEIHNLNVWKGICPSNDNLNLFSYYGLNTEKNSYNFKKGEIGCYLSHATLLKYIKENNHHDFTVILEDDIKINYENITTKIQNILKNFNNFDILYLGLLIENKGKHVKDDIYELNKENNIYGTQSYVINNKNIKKIYDCITHVTSPIDVQYEKAIKNNTLTAYVIYPWLFSQDRDNFNSTINLPVLFNLKKQKKKQRKLSKK